MGLVGVVVDGDEREQEKVFFFFYLRLTWEGDCF